jgi:hypothetical protein
VPQKKDIKTNVRKFFQYIQQLTNLSLLRPSATRAYQGKHQPDEKKEIIPISQKTPENQFKNFVL